MFGIVEKKTNGVLEENSLWIHMKQAFGFCCEQNKDKDNQVGTISTRREPFVGRDRGCPNVLFPRRIY
jgi:hypothetical protein